MGGCYAACSVYITEEAGGSPASTGTVASKRPITCIFFGWSEGRNAVAIFGKRESPQLSIYCLQLQELSMSAVARF